MANSGWEGNPTEQQKTVFEMDAVLNRIKDRTLMGLTYGRVIETVVEDVNAFDANDWLRCLVDEKVASTLLKRHGDSCKILIEALVKKATDMRLLSTLSLIASGHIKESILNRMKELVAPPPPQRPSGHG